MQTQVRKSFIFQRLWKRALCAQSVKCRPSSLLFQAHFPLNYWKSAVNAITQHLMKQGLCQIMH